MSVPVKAVLTLSLQCCCLHQVCFTYNRGTGEFGFCPDKDACRRLHICEKYLRDTCYADDCDRSHDFFEPHPMKSLQARGVSTGMVGSLLAVYRNVLVIWDSNNPGHHCKGRTPFWGLGVNHILGNAALGCDRTPSSPI